MDEERIHIALLGPPEVKYRGKQIEIKRRILRKLFYYLASLPLGKNRAEICEVFWPNDDEISGRKNLRESISLLRSELPIDDVILTQNDLIKLNSEKVLVDLLIFEQLSERLRKKTDLVTNGRLPETTYIEIRDVLRLWRTSEFLDGINLLDSIPFQFWVMQKRETLFYWRQMMMEWMANHYIAVGNLNEALYWLSTAVLKDRQNVELNYLTLNCLKDLGYRSAALHYCDVIDSIYKEGETVVVPKVLQDLVDRVRTDVYFREERKVISWDLFEQKEVDFIGRYDLVDHLAQCVNRGGVYQLIGEPGSGKTRTLKEFYTNLEASPRIAYCRARKEEQNIAYQTFVQGIRDIVTDKDWQQLGHIYALALLQIFPEISKIRTDIQEEDIIRSLELKRLIPESIYELVLIIIGEKRGLLIIDDAHWCDEETIQTLGYILKGKKTNPTVLAYWHCAAIKKTPMLIFSLRT
jgi:DNA-binding SARP family transcriptional activator